MDEGLTITELARRTGLTAQLLRSYERAGLLAPSGPSGGGPGGKPVGESGGKPGSESGTSRGGGPGGRSGDGPGGRSGDGPGGTRNNGRRRYTEGDLARFRLIGRLRATGMTPAELREFAALGGPGADVEQRRRDVLVAHRRRVLARIDQLHEDLALIEYQIQQFGRPGGSLRQPPRG